MNSHKQLISSFLARTLLIFIHQSLRPVMLKVLERCLEFQLLILINFLALIKVKLILNKTTSAEKPSFRFQGNLKQKPMRWEVLGAFILLDQLLDLRTRILLATFPSFGWLSLKPPSTLLRITLL